jgi:hypothetical protein
MSEKFTAQDVFDFAVTTGELYNRHVELAQANADWKAWFTHVKLNVVPRFEREISKGKIVFSPEEIAACGEMLRQYYAEHVKEL